jgi:predicted nucleic acid-binding protein
MDKQIILLIQKNVIRDIQIRLLEAKQDGMVISEKIINEILFNLEDSYGN